MAFLVSLSGINQNFWSAISCLNLIKIDKKMFTPWLIMLIALLIFATHCNILQLFFP